MSMSLIVASGMLVGIPSALAVVKNKIKFFNLDSYWSFKNYNSITTRKISKISRFSRCWISNI